LRIKANSLFEVLESPSDWLKISNFMTTKMTEEIRYFVSVPLVGYPQWYGKRGSTLASTSVVLHGDEKSAGVLPKGTFSPGWPVGTASRCWLR